MHRIPQILLLSCLLMKIVTASLLWYDIPPFQRIQLTIFTMYKYTFFFTCSHQSVSGPSVLPETSTEGVMMKVTALT